MITATDYDSGVTENIEYKFPSEVKSVSVSVDGGRISFYINDTEVYSNCSLRDGCVEITKE
jgi:hypothetical protein